MTLADGRGADGVPLPRRQSPNCNGRGDGSPASVVGSGVSLLDGCASTYDAAAVELSMAGGAVCL